MKQFWVCKAEWLVPPKTCHERGDTDASAEKHTKKTGHPTVTTTIEGFADRLAG